MFAGFDVDSDEDDDDEERVVAALKHITSKISVGPKQSQRQQGRKSSIKPLSRRRITEIAQQVEAGRISLPDLDLEHDKDYVAVWALVDSGAGRSCANKAAHFPFVKSPNRPSTTRMSTANGEELKSRGTLGVAARSAEGYDMSQNFEDTDVDMPIMAVTEVSQCGSKGSHVNFRKDDGAVVNLQNQGSSCFIKRKGVFFMKICVPRDGDAVEHEVPMRSVFSRPGA